MHTSYYILSQSSAKFIQSLLTNITLLCCLCFSALSQQDSLKNVGHIGGWMGYGVVRGNYAYIGLGNNFAVLDVSTPVIQQSASAFLPPGLEITMLDINGKYAFLNYSNDMLHVFDISNPTSPVSLGRSTLPSFTTCTDIHASGDRLYLSDANNGLLICDTTNIGSSVHVLGTYGSVPIWRFDVSGKYIALLNNVSPYEMQILDISNPSAPVKIGSASLTGRGEDIVIKGNYVFVTMNSELRVYDISTPQTPALVKTINWAASPGIITIDSTFLYIKNIGSGFSYTRLRIYDISNPVSPVFISESRDLSGLNSISVQNGNAYLTEGSRFEVFDISNPTNQTFVKEFETPWDIKSFSVNDKQMIVGDEDRMFLYDISSPSNPVLQNVYPQWTSNGRIIINGNNLFSLDNTNNPTKLSVIDITTPSNPQLKSEYTPPAGREIQELKVRQQNIFLGVSNNTTNDGWLYVLDISNPSSPQKIAEIALPAQPKDLFVPDSGNFIYLPYYKSDASRGFVIIDISNPSTPIIKADQHLNADPAAVWIEMDTLIVVSNKTATTWELSIWNVSSKTAPTLISSTTGNGQAWDVEYVDGKIIASLPGGSIHVFQIEPIIKSLVQLFVNLIFQTRDISTSSDGSTLYTSSGYGIYDKKYVSGSQGIDLWYLIGGIPRKQTTLTLGGSPSSSNFCPQDSNHIYQIFEFSLTADIYSDWDLGSIKFAASGSGDEKKDIKAVQLLQQKQKISEGSYSSDNGMITLGINKHLAAGQSMHFRIEYEFQDSIEISAGTKTYSVTTSTSFLNAAPTSSLTGVKQPPTTVTFQGGPLYIGGITNIRRQTSYATIQEAIDAPTTYDGDVIEVCPGTYTENVTVNKSLTIRSKSGKDVTIISALKPSFYTFDITTGNTTIDGFTIKGASGNNSAGIHINGNFQEWVQILHSSIIANKIGIQDERLSVQNALDIQDCKINNNNSDGIQSASEVIANGIEVNDNNGWGINCKKNITIGDKTNTLQNDIQRNLKGGIRCNGSIQNGVKLDVSNNTGPGIAVKNDMYIDGLQANDNTGPGLFSLVGSITITGGKALQNQISRNKGAGIWCNAFGVAQHVKNNGDISSNSFAAPSEVQIQTAITINDNASWGIIGGRGVYVNILNDHPTSDKRPSEVYRNGLATEYYEITDWGADDLIIQKLNSKINPSTGGGLCSQRSDVFAQRVDVSENGGQGIFAGHDINLTVGRANKNRGTGICALTGKVDIYADRYDLNEDFEANENLGSGIQAKIGTFIATSMQIKDNASWGIKCGGQVEVNFFESFITRDNRTSNITGNGNASVFYDTEDYSNDSDYPNNAQVKVSQSLVEGGGIWSKHLTIRGRFLDVSNNGGPGLAAYNDINVRNIHANNNAGHGIFSFFGGVTIDVGLSWQTDDNQVNGNLGCGILASGISGSSRASSGVSTSTSVEIKNNASWGILSRGGIELNLFAGTLTVDQRTSVISGNGAGPFFYDVADWDDAAPVKAKITRNKNIADGGGLWSWKSTIIGNFLEVSKNNGPGIVAQSDIDLRGIHIVDNAGPGVFSQFGKVVTEPVSKSGYPMDEVSANKGFGIWSGGVGGNSDIYLNHSGAFLGNATNVTNNGAWGIGANDNVEIGYYTGVPIHDSRVSRISANGKSPTWFDVEWDVGSTNGVMDKSTVRYKEHTNGGVYSDQKGCRARKTYIGNNGSDGIFAHKNIKLEDFTIFGNSDNGIHTSGALNAHLGNVTVNKGWGVIASAVDSLPLVTIEKNILGGIKLRKGTKIIADNSGKFFNNFEKSNDDSSISLFSPFISSIQLSENGGDGLLDEIGSGLTLHNANIFLNYGYGIRNTFTQFLDIKKCWWGSVDGPSGIGPGKGDEVSINVDYSPWLSKKILLALTPLRDTVFVAVGTRDSAFVLARQFENQIQDVMFTTSDSLNWLVGSPSVAVNPDDPGAAVVTINVQPPAVVPDGSVNKIRVQAVSKSDPLVREETMVYISAYSASPARIILRPDTVRLFPGASTYFRVEAFDQHGYNYPIVTKWSSNGGIFDSTNRFVAGTGIGTFNVTVRDSASGAQTSSIVIIEARQLVRVTMRNHSIRRTSNRPFEMYASGFDQFGKSISFAAGWSSKRGSVDSTFIISDSNSFTALMGVLISAPADSISFLVVVRDSVSGSADTAIVYRPVLKQLVIQPDTVRLPPKSTTVFAVNGYDQYNQLCSLDPVWTAIGGNITLDGVYSAGSTEGVYTVTVRDSITQLQAQAIVNIERTRLAQLIMELDTIRITPNTKITITAVATDQYGQAFTFIPEWIATNGKIENTSSYLDSLKGFIMHADYTSPNATGQFKVFIRDNSSGKADTLIIIVQGPVYVRRDNTPSDVVVYQNYPNPFRAITTITFSLSKSDHVIISVYDIFGNKIATIADQNMAAGMNSIQWNANNIAHGMYYYTLKTASSAQTKRLLLMK